MMLRSCSALEGHDPHQQMRRVHLIRMVASMHRKVNMAQPIRTDDRNGGATADGRDRKGRFAEGNPGRPIGTRHRVTKAVEALLEGEAEALTRKAVELALTGDTTALRLCLERILPPSKGRTVHVELPVIKNAMDGLDALNVVIRSVANGDISVDEGQAVAGLIETHRKELEIVQIDDRLKKLEEAMASK